MCLNLKSKYTLPKFSFRDKVVYKFLIPDSQLKDCYRTPFMDSLVEIGQTVESKLVKYKWDTYASIEEGIHSFIDQKNCYPQALDYSSSTENYFVVVKCIIPKFTKYYKGEFVYIDDSIASTKLIYKEIVYDSKSNS